MAPFGSYRLDLSPIASLNSNIRRSTHLISDHLDYIRLSSVRLVCSRIKPSWLIGDQLLFPFIDLTIPAYAFLNLHGLASFKLSLARLLGDQPLSSCILMFRLILDLLGLFILVSARLLEDQLLSSQLGLFYPTFTLLVSARLASASLTQALLIGDQLILPLLYLSMFFYTRPNLPQLIS